MYLDKSQSNTSLSILGPDNLSVKPMREEVKLPSTHESNYAKMHNHDYTEKSISAGFDDIPMSP